MKTLKNNIVLGAIFTLFGLNVMGQGLGEIRGIIKDKDLQPVPYATIKILQDNILVGGTQSNEEGRYNYKPLTPGIYEMLIIEPGHLTQPVNKIKVIPNEATYVDVKLSTNTFSTIEIMAKAMDYTKTGVDITMFNQVSVDAIDLNRNASYERGNITGALESMSSEVIASSDGEVHFRGSRGDASGYFVDGVRTLQAARVPGLCIENISMFPGGVPAMYGDLTSGVVLVTTKGYFSGLREKNLRVAAYRESIAEQKAQQKAKEEEENRAKEIEKEKAKERESK